MTLDFGLYVYYCMSRTEDVVMVTLTAVTSEAASYAWHSSDNT